ncbi:hypothetical protein [Kytococcus sedentarius]|uniref:hypothetical protein n=1 Tax=Kytococcus sedentarius TaxID=1276 RepID=UPI00384B1E22
MNTSTSHSSRRPPRVLGSSAFLLEHENGTLNLLASPAGFAAAGSGLTELGIPWTPHLADDLDSTDRLEVRWLAVDPGPDPDEVAAAIAGRVRSVFHFAGGYPGEPGAEPAWRFRPQGFAQAGSRHVLVVDYGGSAGSWVFGAHKWVAPAMLAAQEAGLPVLAADLGSGAYRDPACFAVPSDSEWPVVQHLQGRVGVWAEAFGPG